MKHPSMVSLRGKKKYNYVTSQLQRNVHLLIQGELSILSKRSPSLRLPRLLPVLLLGGLVDGIFSSQRQGDAQMHAQRSLY